VVDLLSRITKHSKTLKRDGRKGFIPFITAGDPDLKTTRELIVELAASGRDGHRARLPFTDPMADGPVIQRASERALRHDFGISDVLQIVSDARQEMMFRSFSSATSIAAAIWNRETY